MIYNLGLYLQSHEHYTFKSVLISYLLYIKQCGLTASRREVQDLNHTITASLLSHEAQQQYQLLIQFFD